MNSCSVAKTPPSKIAEILLMAILTYFAISISVMQKRGSPAPVTHNAGVVTDTIVI